MFWKKKSSSSVKYFWSYRLRKMCLFKCITGLVSENPLAVNVLSSPKNLWNPQKSTFILLLLHFKSNWGIKSCFESDQRFKGCLLTRGLSTASILLVIERIYCYQLKSNDLKNHRLFAKFLLHFWYLHKISNVLKEKWVS